MSSNKTFQLFPEKLGGHHVDQFIADQGIVFYDPSVGELRLGDGVSPGGISLFKALASNFGLSADGGTTIPVGASIIVYDGGNATTPYNIWDILDGNTSISPNSFDASAQYTFTNTISFSNTININGIKAAGVLGNTGQVLTSTGYNVVWANAAAPGTTLPADASGQLTNDGAGNLSWTVPSATIANNTTLNFSAAAPAVIADSDGATISLVNGQSVGISNFSGMLLVNDHWDGGVAVYVAGGGDGVLIANTRSAFPNTVTLSGTGYDWYNSTNLTGPFTFTVIKTRNGS